MTSNSTPLDKLRSFLNQLFQFETQDLDFGVYKILHYKRKEIKDFIDNLLVEQVKQQLQTLSAEEAEQIAEQLAELEKDSIIEGWLKAEGDERKTLEKYGKEKINQYQELKGKATEARVSVETENQIYNHLSLFFSRYYDKGDFISKRRFGKNEKYMVPYNGEETHFHWANHDQYYIKSSETFQHFAFKVLTSKGAMATNFKLTAAQVEQGNVKAEEANYFVLSEKEAKIGEEESTFFFEYRPLTEEEKKHLKGNNKQDTLDEQAFEALKERFGKEAALAELWKAAKDEKPLLLKKLHHYTRKNKHDFFIHKNLKAFLERELDFYIKSELISVDDLYVTDSDSHFDRLKHNLKTIKVFKAIADTIIAFVSQLEEFQKKLWEKKKFVLGTEWVISIDRLVEYIGEEAARPILEEVVENEKQVAEWEELFGEENVPKDLSVDGLKVDLHSWRKLPIDTGHFNSKFKYSILSVISEGRDLEESTNGLVTETDNFHGLNLLQDKFNELVNTIYIDPPYNSGGNDFTYKDSFRNSSWLSMLGDRIPLARNLMEQDGLFFTSIDDKDPKNKVVHRLSNLLESEFGKENYIENIIWIKNTTHNDSKAFSHNHEYIQSYTKNKDAAIQEHEMFRKAKPGYAEVQELIHKLNKEYPPITVIRKKLRSLYKAQEKDYRVEVEALGLEWNNDIKKNNPWKGIRQYKYAEYRNNEGQFVEEEKAKEIEAKIWIFRESDPSWPNSNSLSREHKNPTSEEYRFYKPVHPVSRRECPAPSRGWLWRFNSSKTALSFEEMEKKKLINYGDDENKVPQYKRFLDTVTTDVAKSTITDFTDGEKELANIVGERGTFPNPKPTTIVRNLLSLSSKRKGYVLDFFAGSGTTANSIMSLNDVEERSLSFIIQDMAKNIHYTIIPRIKKIAYTFDWKDGKPKDGSMNGLGVFFKYQRLEQYEEALENISFSAPEEATQKALQFDQYIPKYFLEFETRDSKTFVNTSAMQDPWDYKLRVWDGFTYDTEQAVDLVETFNYLIGLHMQKCITKEFNGKKYQFIHGNNNANKKITVVWRSVKDWSLEDYAADAELLKEELKTYPYDLLYLNDQAHLEGYQPIEEVFKNKMLS